MPSIFEQMVLIPKIVSLGFALTYQRLMQIFTAKIHRLTYSPVDRPKNVVVVGGSFGGFYLAKGLAESLPTGWRVVLIEKKSHFHFTWNFPRISVVSGHDHKCFIPFPRQLSTAPQGVYLFKQGNVVAIDPLKVTLEDKTTFEYEYLAIATGSQARYPAKLDADVKSDCIRFFQEQRRQIEAAKDIVVVGGGAAGVEVAGDIKTRHPDKHVTLVHSRDHILNNFGEALHEITKKALEEMGVSLYLGERVVSGLDSEAPEQVTLGSGKALRCDRLIKCTGQSAQSDLVKQFSPSSVAPSGGLIVEKTLQLKNSPSPQIFALGDVLDISGPKQGRAASLQGFHVADNIVRSIKQTPLKDYKPTMIDVSIDLTLGLASRACLNHHRRSYTDKLYVPQQGKGVAFIDDFGRRHLSIKQTTTEELQVARGWEAMGMKPFHDPEEMAANELDA
ncbi:hypothetical protein A1O3_06543 [Capronia epimyces CBS 606.96]|uniref:FAD/NAD(P)-binding domain-containing protein n=1 Tax=Capronia epimyces CBS 606.96 TaxID=1182542 RepID=W9XR70_9EURO|nr:uncharacterized protein A1O3_06543 [Capronia epimyces CBS 606.96]EXJ82728.1 hypothetical protein A1O3_06543 [Capronia epimyces CBS 606.96]